MVGPTLWGAGGLHTQCAATACSNCSLKWHHVQSLHVVSVPGFIILYEKSLSVNVKMCTETLIGCGAINYFSSTVMF